MTVQAVEPGQLREGRLSVRLVIAATPAVGAGQGAQLVACTAPCHQMFGLVNTVYVDHLRRMA